MDLYERQDLQNFLVSLYGTQAYKWHMNEGIFNLTYELVVESGLCSSVMDFVPRPMPPGVSAMKYLAKQAREMFLRSISNNKKQYVICLRVVSAKMVNRFKLEALGQ